MCSVYAPSTPLCCIPFQDNVGITKMTTKNLTTCIFVCVPDKEGSLAKNPINLMKMKDVTQFLMDHWREIFLAAFQSSIATISVQDLAVYWSLIKGHQYEAEALSDIESHVDTRLQMEIEKLWVDIDTSKDGLLQQVEILRATGGSQEVAEHFIAMMDMDKDVEVDKREWLAFFERLQQRAGREGALELCGLFRFNLEEALP